MWDLMSSYSCQISYALEDDGAVDNCTSYLKVTIICRYIFFAISHCKAHFASTNFCDLNAEMVQGRLILMFVVHIVMFASTKFCVFGPIRKNIKR